MMPQKLCPKCQTIADLYASECLRCGHVYRTQFAPPLPQYPPARRLSPRRRILLFATLVAVVACIITTVEVFSKSSKRPLYDGNPKVKIVWVSQQGASSIGNIYNMTDRPIPGVRVFVTRFVTASRSGFATGGDFEPIPAMFIFDMDDPRGRPLFSPTKLDLEPRDSAGIMFRGVVLDFPADVKVESEGREIPCKQEFADWAR